MRTVGVYGIRSTITGKYYVGSSVDIRRRWATHRKELASGTHVGIKLLHAWRKYGSDAWEWVVLEECLLDRKQLLEREQHWIDTLSSYENGYNSLPKAGQGTRGRKQTPEEVAKRVATRRARNNFGHTEETKKLIGDSQKGKKRGPMSEAQRRLLSKIKLEKGMPESERQRMSKMARERVYTDEIRRNMSLAHQGYVMPEEQKRKIASSNLGKSKSPEAMAKTLKSRQDRGGYILPAMCRKYGLPMVPRLCKICQTPFEPKGGWEKVCSPECSKAASSRAAKKLWTGPNAPKGKASTTKEFIEKAIRVHGERFGYGKVVYKKRILPVTIVCPVHGDFQQTPNGHLAGRGCHICKETAMAERNKNNTEIAEMSRIASCKCWNINRGKLCTCGKHQNPSEILQS